jgi:hypothetical protein
MSKKHRHLLEGIERYVYSHDLLKVTTSCIIHIIKNSLEINSALLMHINYFSCHPLVIKLVVLDVPTFCCYLLDTDLNTCRLLQ